MLMPKHRQEYPTTASDGRLGGRLDLVEGIVMLFRRILAPDPTESQEHNDFFEVTVGGVNLQGGEKPKKPQGTKKPRKPQDPTESQELYDLFAAAIRGENLRGSEKQQKPRGTKKPRKPEDPKKGKKIDASDIPKDGGASKTPKDGHAPDDPKDVHVSDTPIDDDFQWECCLCKQRTWITAKMRKYHAEHKQKFKCQGCPHKKCRRCKDL